MNLVRSVISILLVILFGVSIAGWIWAGGLPDDKMFGARAVLACCGLLSVGALVLLWSARQQAA